MIEGGPSGIFTRQQAVAVYGEPQVRRWARQGQWVRPFFGIYASQRELLMLGGRERAALASAGPGLVLVGESAARLHGFGVLDTSRVQLAGPPGKTARSPRGIRLHGRDIGVGIAPRFVACR